MAGSLKTEGIVLRSLRYGEADRILHVLTPHRGRLGVIAKGVRRSRSRFGGRLEPFLRVRLVLYEGRSDLLTVTGVDTVEVFKRIRADARRLDAAGRACDAVARLFDAGDPHPEVFHLLGNFLALLDEDPAPPDRAGRGASLAFRLKLLVAAGLTPQLGSCAQCGEEEGLVAFSGAAGGVVCEACEGSGFPLSAEAHAFLVAALGAPLAAAPTASVRALGQAERAVGETAEHHAHVRLRPLAG